MNTHKIEANTVPESSPTGKAPEEKLPRKEVPPGPGKQPSLVVVPTPNPPPAGGPG